LWEIGKTGAIRKNELDSIVGNTPLLEIRFKFKGHERRIFSKAEHLNLTGSIKDISKDGFGVKANGYFAAVVGFFFCLCSMTT